MSVKTKDKKYGGAGEEFELLIPLCRMFAILLSKLPEDDRQDLADVLMAMGQSSEEMEQGEVTIREMLAPKAGLLLPALMPAAFGRADKVKKWSTYVSGRVHELRKEAGLTQQQLADNANLPQSHVSRIESGEISPTRHTVEKIAKALGRTIDDFDPT